MLGLFLAACCGEELSPLLLSPVGMVIINLLDFLPIDNCDCVCFFLVFFVVFFRGLITWTTIPCFSDASERVSVDADDSACLADSCCFLKKKTQEILSMYAICCQSVVSVGKTVEICHNRPTSKSNRTTANPI